jgi:hypothetical protein
MSFGAAVSPKRSRVHGLLLRLRAIVLTRGSHMAGGTVSVERRGMMTEDSSKNERAPREHNWTAEKDGPLAEYNALRAEILGRQAAQQNLLTLQLTASGAVLSFALATVGRNFFLLILPFTSYMLCGRYARQNVFIVNIGLYTREVLARKISGGLEWEDWRTRHPRLPLLTRVIEPLYMTFPGVAFLALVIVAPAVFSTRSSGLWSHLGLSALWLLGLLVSVSTVQLARSFAGGARSTMHRFV